MDVHGFWRAVLRQDAQSIRMYFHENAYVNWHCTNERFTVEEFIRANCEYPGNWDGDVQRVEYAGETVITVTRVYPKDQSASFHVTSFMRIEDDRIAAMDEYWADDGDAPQWRKAMHIGRPIYEQM